jgi:arabinose-5-phosphate isomerase
MTTDPIVERVKTVLETERDAIHNTIDRCADAVAKAAQTIMDREPRDVIVTGVGKSGHVASKIASTLTSVGTRSHFVSTSEMFHGDLGAVDQAGAVIVISKSGSGADIAQLADFVGRRDIPLIGIIGDRHAALVQKLSVFIDASVHKEADPEGFVPTSSTTVALVLGDAIAVALMEMRRFTSSDFAVFHPNGALGARLNKTVADVMAGLDAIPLLGLNSSVRDLAVEMSHFPTGLALVTDDSGGLAGVVSDGDLRRALITFDDLKTASVAQVLTKDPTTIGSDVLLAHALAVMEGHSPRPISALPVIDDGKIVGLVTIHQIHKETPS